MRRVISFVDSKGKYSKSFCSCKPEKKFDIDSELTFLAYLRKKDSSKYQSDIANTLERLAIAYNDIGDPNNYLNYSLEALLIKQQNQTTKSNSDILSSLFHVINAYQMLGDPENSLKYALESLKISNELYPNKKHPNVANAMNKVAIAYNDLGQYERFLDLSLEALRIREEYLGPCHPDVASSYNTVALAFRKMGQMQNFFDFSLKALEMRKKLLGPEHKDLATSLNNVALAHRSLGNFTSALNFANEALNMRKNIYSNYHADIVSSYDTCAIIYSDMGKPQKSLELLQEALNLAQKIYTEDHPKIASIHLNMAIAHKDLGDLENFLKYSLISLKMRRSLYGDMHPDIADSLNNVAIAYRNLGDKENGLKLSVESLNMFKTIYGENDHLDIARGYVNVANAYHSAGDVEKFFENALKAIDMAKKLGYWFNNLIATVLTNLAVSYKHMGKLDYYLNYTTEALAIREKILDKEHPEIANSLYKCAIGHYNLGDEANFFKIAKKSINMLKKINGTENMAEIGNLYQAIAIFYYKKNDYENFFEYSTKALNIRQNLHTQPHPNLVISYYFVARAFGYIGDMDKEEFYLLKALKMKKKILDTQNIYISLENASELVFENTPGVVVDRKQELKDSLEHRHIMICHHSNSNKLVMDLKAGLERQGYRIWMNENDNAAKSLHLLFNRIENSGAVLICIDNYLNQNRNNKLEILLAAEIDIPLLAIKMEPVIEIQEWLHNLIAHRKIFDFEQLKNFELFIKRLALEVESIRI